MKEIKVIKASTIGTKPHISDSELGFGKYTTDHMFLMDYESGKGWYDPRIVPYQPLTLDPCAMVLHYNQEVFEGLKAYHLADGGVGLFRPEKNIIRMNASARRLVMPEVDQKIFIDAIKQLVLLDRDWLPTSKGTSIYIRPTIIATEPALGVRLSNQYLFYIVMGPVGPYYPEGFKPTRILVTHEYVRAAEGGVGLAGEEQQKINFQIHCGPALGAFNQWVKGTNLENWRSRHVDQIADKLMHATAELLNSRFEALLSCQQ